MAEEEGTFLELGEVTVYVTHHDGREDVSTCKSEQDFQDMVYANVAKVHEIKVVDNTDSIIFQVIDKTLIFPIPEHGASNNVWNEKTDQFETVPLNG